MSDYHINVFYSDKDECYVADIPDLRYCSACGETPEEALRELANAQQESHDLYARWAELSEKAG